MFLMGPLAEKSVSVFQRTPEYVAVFLLGFPLPTIPKRHPQQTEPTACLAVFLLGFPLPTLPKPAPSKKVTPIALAMLNGRKDLYTGRGYRKLLLGFLAVAFKQVEGLGK